MLWSGRRTVGRPSDDTVYRPLSTARVAVSRTLNPGSLRSAAVVGPGSSPPHLKEGDRVAYLTVKGKYLEDIEPGWRLVAILGVVKPFRSHDEGASWYLQRACALPANCIAAGNPPKRFEITSGNAPKDVKGRAKGDPALLTEYWNDAYRERIAQWPNFCATEAQFLNLVNPPQLSPERMANIFGRIPGTQSPPRIELDQMEQLLQIASDEVRLAQAEWG
jgi:hypothetical protein